MVRQWPGVVGGGKGRCLVGSLWVSTEGHLIVTVGHPMVSRGHLRVTIGYL